MRRLWPVSTYLAHARRTCVRRTRHQRGGGAARRRGGSRRRLRPRQTAKCRTRGVAGYGVRRSKRYYNRRRKRGMCGKTFSENAGFEKPKAASDVATHAIHTRGAGAPRPTGGLWREEHASISASGRTIPRAGPGRRRRRSKCDRTAGRRRGSWARGWPQGSQLRVPAARGNAGAERSTQQCGGLQGTWDRKMLKYGRPAPAPWRPPLS